MSTDWWPGQPQGIPSQPPPGVDPLDHQMLRLQQKKLRAKFWLGVGRIIRGLVVAYVFIHFVIKYW